MIDQHKKIFSQAYHDYAPRVYRHIYFKVGNRHLAEDFTQETFLRTWKYVIAGEKKIDNLKDFLYSVANNLIIDHYRDKSRSAVSLESAHHNPALVVGPRQIKRIETILSMGIVNKHLAEMKRVRREIIHYRYVDDLSVKEIGRLTNKSPNHISVIIHRSIREIQKRLNLL